MTEEKQITIFETSESQHQDYKVSLDELQTELSKFSLTPNQSKVYIFLGKYGAKTAPEVCKALKIARTETYHLLSTLQSKGIVSASFEHPIKFSALPLTKAMKTLLNAEKERVKILEKHEEQITKLWENIPEFAETQVEVENKFQMLQGINPINSKLFEMITTSNESLVIVGSEKDHLKMYHLDLFSEIANTSVKTKIITNCNEKTKHVFEDLKTAEVKRALCESPCFILKDEKEMMFFTKNYSHKSQELMAMWTTSDELIKSMKLLFNFLWSTSKIIK